MDAFDAAFKQKHPSLAGVDNAVAVSVNGRGLAELNLGPVVAPLVQTLRGNFTGVDDGEPTELSPQTYTLTGNRKLGDVLAHVAAGFGSRAMTSCAVALESSDWHGDKPSLDKFDGKQGAWNRYLGNALAGFLTSAEQTDDPFEPGKKIIDSLLIVVSSEFTRTAVRQSGGTDNGDGGTNALCLIGSGVKSGSYGNIDGPSGGINSFDPLSGNVVPQGSAPVTEAMVWKTVGKLLGASDVVLNSHVPDSQAKAITAVMR